MNSPDKETAGDGSHENPFRFAERLPPPEEVKSFYKRNEMKIKIGVVVVGAYWLNKRAVRKVVTKVVRGELTQYSHDFMDLSLSPEWQQKLADSYVRNGFFR